MLSGSSMAAAAGRAPSSLVRPLRRWGASDGRCCMPSIVRTVPFLQQLGRSSNGGVGGKRAVAVEAKKGKRRGEKSDTHSAVPKSDEATGPFPESVLLKKKSAQEDGRVLPEFADAEEEELYDFFSLQLESDLNVERVRHYEVVYLIHEAHVDAVEDVTSKVQDFIRERKGRIWRLNNWGLRRLAYKIQKARKANYILMNFELESKNINEFKTMLDKEQRIIRHLVIKRDEAITEDCPPPQEFHSLQMDEDDDEDDDEYELEDDDDIVVIDDEEDGANGGDKYDENLMSEAASR